MKDKDKMSFNDFVKNDKFKKIILIAGFLGIALIFLSTFTSFETPKENTETSEPLFSVTEYCDTMQTNLTDMVESIEGVGSAKVLLTIENSVECVYLENSTTKTKQIEPLIRGVVVACQGGENPVVVEGVMSAVTKALNISTAKVCVTKLSST